MTNKIKIMITGKNPNYLLKEIIRNRINIYYLEKYNNTVIIIILEKDYKIIKNMKTTNKIKIISYYGNTKYKHIIKNNKYFIFLIIIGILINIILSNIIWKVEVINPNKKIIKVVTKDLNKYGIKKYRLKLNYNKRNIVKNKILKEERDIIEWLEIEEVGCKYIVKVERRKKLKEDKECNYRNIVSKKNAIILSIEARDGEVIRKINDYVEKGDTIISGLIYNKEEIVSKKCAKGIVYGETWYKITTIIPKTINKEILEKEKDYGVSINILKKEYNLFNKLRNYKKNEYNIIDSKIIPVKVSFVEYQKLNNIKETYNINTIDKKAEEVAVKEMNKRLNKEEEILDKKVLKKQVKNSKIEVDVFLKVKENITDYIDITDIDINQMNKKGSD